MRTRSDPSSAAQTTKSYEIGSSLWDLVLPPPLLSCLAVLQTRKRIRQRVRRRVRRVRRWVMIRVRRVGWVRRVRFFGNFWSFVGAKRGPNACALLRHPQ
eukprot:1173834-Prorocentrum_minimum.AAC.1